MACQPPRAPAVAKSPGKCYIGWFGRTPATATKVERQEGT
jgi:hypothetical protein